MTTPDDYCDRDVPAKRRPSARKEDKLDKLQADWLKAVLGRPGKTNADGVLWHACETRAKRSVWEGARNKARGCVAGFPLDKMFMYRGRLFKFENKEPGRRNHKNGGLSDDQVISVAEYRAAGIPVVVGYSVEDLRDALGLWGIPTREAG